MKNKPNYAPIERIIAKFMVLMDLLREDLVLVRDKSNMSAAQRVRVRSLELALTAKKFRKASVEIVNNFHRSK